MSGVSHPKSYYCTSPTQAVRAFNEADTVKDMRIKWALELLKGNHLISIAEVATKLNLSPSRFRHLFKSELNIAPMSYVKHARMQHAKDLVENSFLRIKEIAALVGAKDVSHFVRDYKIVYGQTPSKSRRHMHQQR